MTNILKTLRTKWDIRIILAIISNNFMIDSFIILDSKTNHLQTINRIGWVMGAHNILITRHSPKTEFILRK